MTDGRNGIPRLTDITERLADYAKAVDRDRGFSTGLTDALRDAAMVIEEQDLEIVRLQALVDEYERPKA